MEVHSSYWCKAFHNARTSQPRSVGSTCKQHRTLNYWYRALCQCYSTSTINVSSLSSNCSRAGDPDVPCSTLTLTLERPFVKDLYQPTSPHEAVQNGNHDHLAYVFGDDSESLLWREYCDVVDLPPSSCMQDLAHPYIIVGNCDGAFAP